MLDQNSTRMYSASVISDRKSRLHRGSKCLVFVCHVLQGMCASMEDDGKSIRGIMKKFNGQFWMFGIVDFQVVTAWLCMFFCFKSGMLYFYSLLAECERINV